VVANDTDLNTAIAAELRRRRERRWHTAGDWSRGRLDSVAMGTFAILLVGAVVATAFWSWLASGTGGRQRRRTGTGPLGLRSADEILEQREALDAEDLSQLLEACNARRRRRGERERTLADVELQLTRERHDATGGTRATGATRATRPPAG
jgi:hypothetical protein